MVSTVQSDLSSNVGESGATPIMSTARDREAGPSLWGLSLVLELASVGHLYLERGGHIDIPTVMHSARSSTMRSVMCIPEIRSHVFSFSMPQANVSNALVCKSWSEDALNVIWRNVEGPGCLFRLLAPLKYNQAGKIEFSRFLSPDDWLRFDTYAVRVFSLKEWYDPNYYTEGDKWSDYDPTVFTQLATTRPDSRVLPNLRDLYFSGPPQFASLFLSPRLESFEITIGDEDESATDQLVSGLQAALLFIPKYSPNLETLQVFFRYPCVAGLDMVLARSLARLPALTTLYLPNGWLTKQVTHAVASHAALYVIESDDMDRLNLTDPINVNDVFSSNLSQNNFPSLEELALVIPFSRAAACLSGAYLPSNLTRLQLRSPLSHLESLHDFTYLIRAIASRCPHLRELTLRANSLPGEPVEAADFGTISPLLKCTQLESLNLHHPIPFNLHSNDLVSLADALPSLETLILNHAPRQSQARVPTLRLSALLKLPQVCPKLRRLGLYIDATHPVESITDIHVPRFSSLEVLSVGLSPISNALSVAGFLGRILPTGMSIDVSYDSSVSERGPRWNEVARFLEVILGIREAERQRGMSLHNQFC